VFVCTERGHHSNASNYLQFSILVLIVKQLRATLLQLL